MVLRQKAEKQQDRQIEVSNYGKRRLLTYADSFRELARSLEGEFDYDMVTEDRQSLLTSRKLWENRQILCGNLNEMARIMTQVASEVFRCRPVEEKKSRLITQALKAEGLYVTDLFYIERTGERPGIGMTLHTDRRQGYTSEEVADMLSVLLDQRLEASVASPYQVDREPHNYVFVEEAKYIVLTGTARAVKETESQSGDNYSIIESERGKLTVLLSDGMGSGEKACADSEKVLDLMEKMLEAGYGMETALNLVNSALIACGEEHNMSTLDICELDLYQGSLEMRKIGAAASFLKRGTMVEQITARSLPLGIFQSVETEVIRRELMDGDICILMSDGVLDALEKNNYEEAMCQVIRTISEQNPKEIADRLLQFALHCSGGRVADDMTIVVIGIWSNAVNGES